MRLPASSRGSRPNAADAAAGVPVEPFLRAGFAACSVAGATTCVVCVTPAGSSSDDRHAYAKQVSACRARALANSRCSVIVLTFPPGTVNEPDARLRTATLAFLAEATTAPDVRSVTVPRAAALRCRAADLDGHGARGALGQRCSGQHGVRHDGRNTCVEPFDAQTRRQKLAFRCVFSGSGPLYFTLQQFSEIFFLYFLNRSIIYYRKSFKNERQK